ncbi:hypothetical protein FRB96_006612 [Tulasnella sp. 330]|nr:hypothetical protein FRB96_006612 [Tulasnella sp. 330]
MALTDHVSERHFSPTTNDLPNELLDLIFRRCGRDALTACCLANKNLHNLAVIHLYKAPFGDDDSRESFDAETGDTRSFALCGVLAENPHLALLVREFTTFAWGSHMLTSMEMGLVVPHLRNLTTAKLHRHIDTFARLCPSTRLRNIYTFSFDYDIENTFVDWLVSQKELRNLDLCPYHTCTATNLVRSKFPKLERLRAYAGLAKATLASPIPTLRQFITRTGSLSDVEEFAMLLRNQCPDIRLIDIGVVSSDNMVGF